jgi:hypothetical protein
MKEAKGRNSDKHRATKQETNKVDTSRSVLLTKHHSGDQIKKTEMGGACGTYGVGDRCIKGVGGKT